jgi:hypothetical protein
LAAKPNYTRAVLYDRLTYFLPPLPKFPSCSLKPLEKFASFMDDETELQLRNGNNIYIIYREMLVPYPEGEVVVKDHLFKVQDYLSQFMADGVADGSLSQAWTQTYRLRPGKYPGFFFMAKNHIRDAFGFEETTLKNI